MKSDISDRDRDRGLTIVILICIVALTFALLKIPYMPHTKVLRHENGMHELILCELDGYHDSTDCVPYKNDRSKK